MLHRYGCSQLLLAWCAAPARRFEGLAPTVLVVECCCCGSGADNGALVVRPHSHAETVPSGTEERTLEVSAGTAVSAHTAAIRLLILQPFLSLRASELLSDAGGNDGRRVALQQAESGGPHQGGMDAAVFSSADPAPQHRSAGIHCSADGCRAWAVVSEQRLYKDVHDIKTVCRQRHTAR